VLYNNMLQSLFESQILTLGVVVIALMGMFLILFRSLKVALIAIAPNLLAIGTVLGMIGWLNIPLDMMTITIAAISINVNALNYELKRDTGRSTGMVDRVEGYRDNQGPLILDNRLDRLCCHNRGCLAGNSILCLFCLFIFSSLTSTGLWDRFGRR